MTVTKFAKLLPAVGLACAMALPAMAQTAPANSGTMAPMSPNNMSHSASPMAKAAKEKTKAGGLPADQKFSTASAAAAHCPNSTVEWTALSHSKSYHASSSKLYGKTKHGAYACKSDLDAAGFHQAKN